MKTLLSLPILAVLLFPAAVSAQEVEYVRDTETIVKARVLEVETLPAGLIEGTEVITERQRLSAEVLEGPEDGRVVSFENDYTQLEEGDTFYLRHSVSATDGTETWSASDPYRISTLLVLTAIFLVLLFAFGGIQGIRGLASLIGSVVLIFYVLIPNIYAGSSPILISIGVASLIIFLGSYVTHGFTRTTTAAMLGMLATVVITGIGTYFAISFGQLSGFSSEANVYLNFATAGRIDMIGLLFGAIIIGLLGVLYDGAIGQAVAVEELFLASSNYTPTQVFWRAMRIGREHIGALVNTLAIAYVGTALPLLLLFQQSTSSITYILNGELFATEIIRILMGSIGLVLAVPVTTLVAVWMLRNVKQPSGTHGHSHAH